MTYETPVGANMFAYCMNNPVSMADDGGEWAHIAAGAVIGGAINVATSYVAAKVSGQGYSIKDGVIAFGIGAIGSLGLPGKVAAGIISGVTTGVSNYANGASYLEAVITGGISAGVTLFSIGNMAYFVDDGISLAVGSLSDLTFGLGGNITSAVANKAVINDTHEISNNTTVYTSNRRSRSTINGVHDPYWRTK